MSRVANENPLDSGNDASSVESAAASFTRMLADEGKPSRSEAGNKSSGRRSEPEEDEDDKSSASREAPDTDTDDDGQSSQPERDEFLDGDAEDGDENQEGDDEKGDDDDADDKDDDGEDDGDLDWDREVEIQVAGKTETLTLAEIAAGYQRDADYRQKTTALAEERREVVEYAAEAVEERQHYAANAQRFIDMAKALEPTDADWAALRNSNPQAFISAKEQWDGIRKQVADAEAERDKVAERARIEAERNYKNWVGTQNAKLLEKMPVLANPAKAREFQNLIMKYGREAGYSDQEIVTGAVDARDVITLYKAAKYDEIQRSRKAGQRPGKGNGNRPKAPAHTSPSAPRSLGKQTPGKSRQGVRDADRRLARSGSQEDAAMAFTEMLRS